MLRIKEINDQLSKISKSKKFKPFRTLINEFITLDSKIEERMHHDSNLDDLNDKVKELFQKIESEKENIKDETKNSTEYDALNEIVYIIKDDYLHVIE